MKYIYAIITVLFIASSLCLPQQVKAQSPEKISYQAVIRDASDKLVISKEIGMQISVLKGSVTGIEVYEETQTPPSNVNGLITVEIGTGTTSDDFSAIDWSNDSYFIKTEIDPTGGINYTITGTNQLLSVPYALHAKTAETISGDITESDPSFTAWDKSTGISITESQISDLQNYLTAEVDPQFAAWNKTTGIVITESQISDLTHFSSTDETDPVFNTSVASHILANDTLVLSQASSFG